jgi:SAM-dependent methyltransferase
MIPQKQSTHSPFCKACHGPLSGAPSRGVKNGYALLTCGACGTVTVDPFPTVEELIAFYQSYEGTADYLSKKDRKIHRARRRIRRLLKYTRGKKFLDIGSNYGFSVKAALELGLDAHGIDIDRVRVEDSKKMFGPHFTACAVQDYTGGADMIYTSEVIEHVPDPDSFVAAIARILNPGGALYLTTPDGGHWRIPKDFTRWDACMPPEHIIYFTRKGLTQLLEKHGLAVEKVFFALKPGIRLIARKKA